MEVKEAREYIGRFKFQEDLLGALSDFCKRENLKLGVFSIIGALTKVRLGYYHQIKQQYVECLKLDKKLEIVSCIGNISLYENDIFVHVHISLADHSGRCYGGHLLPGSVIFAAEYHIKELSCAELERSHDKDTGLNLWPY
tara:strand:+ start:541 stop:963 length:423 start_codon:yes stop_codon:yes gene_type:complete